MSGQMSSVKHLTIVAWWRKFWCGREKQKQWSVVMVIACVSHKLPFHMSIHHFLHLSCCLSAYLFIYLSVSVYLSVCPSLCLSVYLFICLCLAICLSLCSLFICLQPVCLSVCLLVWLSIICRGNQLSPSIQEPAFLWPKRRLLASWG